MIHQKDKGFFITNKWPDKNYCRAITTLATRILLLILEDPIYVTVAYLTAVPFCFVEFLFEIDINYTYINNFRMLQNLPCVFFTA